MIRRHGVFVTGTDTEIGKTLIAKALVRRWVNEGYRTAAMKPVASGCWRTRQGLRNADAECLRTVSNINAAYELVNPYSLLPPVAPHLAAAAAGVTIQLQHILACFEQLVSMSDRIVVEGVGGWLVPLGPDTYVSDLALALGLPVILVVGIRLGCLNHALLTATAMRAAGAPLLGWVANHIDVDVEHSEANIAALRRRLDAPLLGTVRHLQDPDGHDVSRDLSSFSLA